MIQSARQAMANLIADAPCRALDELQQKLSELKNPYLQTSYVWRQVPWEEATFRAGGRWYQLRLDATEALETMDPSQIKATLNECGELR